MSSKSLRSSSVSAILGGRAIAMDGRGSGSFEKRSTDASEGTARGSARAGARRRGEVREARGLGGRVRPRLARSHARGRVRRWAGPRRVRGDEIRATGTVDRSVPHRRYWYSHAGVHLRQPRRAPRRFGSVLGRANWKKRSPAARRRTRSGRARCPPTRSPRPRASRRAPPARPFRRANALPPRLARPPPPPRATPAAPLGGRRRRPRARSARPPAPKVTE
mgnify:CR=1 FL=1